MRVNFDSKTTFYLKVGVRLQTKFCIHFWSTTQLRDILWKCYLTNYKYICTYTCFFTYSDQFHLLQHLCIIWYVVDTVSDNIHISDQDADNFLCHQTSWSPARRRLQSVLLQISFVWWCTMVRGRSGHWWNTGR